MLHRCEFAPECYGIRYDNVRLYLTYKDKNYMATDISNHSLVKGSGYWLGAY